MITPLETIAEEFANTNEVQLLDAISENNEVNPSQVRYVRRTEGVGKNYFFLEYSKEYENVADKNKFVRESLSINNGNYLLSVNAGIGTNYGVEIASKRVLEAVNAAREISSFNEAWDSCKPSVIGLPVDDEGLEALKELIKTIFK